MSIEQKRQRREKRKQRKAKRRPCRPPSFVACHYVEDQIHPDADILRNAFDCARDRSAWMRLPYRPIDSEPYQCWHNVEKAVLGWGGKMVCGWWFRIDPMPGITNCMADFEARPHAVWCDDTGTLYEVSHDCRGGFFLPSDKVKPFLALKVGFTDTEFQAQTYRPPNSLFMPRCGNFYIPLKETTNERRIEN